MNRTLVPGLLGVIGLLIFVERVEAAPHPICGTWKLKQPGIGESEVKITENVAEDGTFDVQEMGLGNAVGTATFRGGILTIHFYTGDLRAFVRLEIDKAHERGHGKTVFTRYPPDYQTGEERTIEGQKVREVREVTVHRIGR
jgi:hypothetical protein